MKVTTLIENRQSKTDRRLAAEWGLSLHIGFNGHNILFDTGASGAFAKNAEHLSVSIASVDIAVLSHHHYDHGGGIKQFFELNSRAKVYMGHIPNGDCFVKIFRVVKNMVDTVSQEFKGIPIKAVIGGFHLIGVPHLNLMLDSGREVEKLGRSVLNYPIDETYTGHCTGDKALKVLKSVMGVRLTDIRTGTTFEV
jgi:metal-dependent hydrolase (beta-lactamase superfamily II)